MYHDVLYLWKFFFNGVMYMFGYLMTFTQSLVSVRAYLYIHINTVSENSCFEHVYSDNIILT